MAHKNRPKKGNPRNMHDLQEKLKKAGVPDNSYYIEKDGKRIGGHPCYEGCFIENKAGSWIVYNEERGHRFALGTFRTEEEAAAFFYRKMNGGR